MSPRYQFSLRSLLWLIAVVSVSLAGILQVPHWFVFGLSCAFAVLASLAAYRARAKPRLRLALIVAAVPAWIALYALSLGPFIALSELDRKVTRRHHVGRLASVYLPVMRFKELQGFKWYASQWIPKDAIGLQELRPNKIPSELVGTWRTGSANHVNLRADGTGRAIDRAGDPQKVLYFEWTCDANQLAIYQYASKRSATAWFGQAAINYRPTDTFDVIEVSESHFTLRDSTGRTVGPTRTQDNELESLP